MTNDERETTPPQPVAGSLDRRPVTVNSLKTADNESAGMKMSDEDARAFVNDLQSTIEHVNTEQIVSEITDEIKQLRLEEACRQLFIRPNDAERAEAGRKHAEWNAREERREKQWIDSVRSTYNKTEEKAPAFGSKVKAFIWDSRWLMPTTYTELAVGYGVASAYGAMLGVLGTAFAVFLFNKSFDALLFWWDWFRAVACICGIVVVSGITALICAAIGSLLTECWYDPDHKMPWNREEKYPQ